MMEVTLTDDYSLLRDSAMDLNDNSTDPPMALALDALGDELNASIPAPQILIDSNDIGEPAIGMEFDSDEAAKEYYIAYANHVGFGVRMNKSRRSRKDDTVIMRRFVCTREGFHSKRVIYDDGKKKRKRGTTREGCMAMIEVIRKEHGKWLVTKLETEHTHMVTLPHKVRPRVGRSIILPNSALIPSEPNGFNNLKNFNRGIRVNPFGEGGEAQGLLDYLNRMQAENPAFFYAIQVDNNNCLTNVFWADAKSRMAYQNFGDAVTFDTSYKKTKYMMPFATFRGVNHHLQSVTFGCALLMDETKGSYVWLFETWLAAMGGRHHPLSLFTDRDKAMEGAISRVFPRTRHCFCKWHILSRCKQKLCDVYIKYPTLRRELKECINYSETVEEFETRWEYLLDKYNLWDNAWLQSLYEIRSHWASVYQKDLFYPELSPSQRPESLNKFFKRNFNTKTSLLLFITKFDQAMSSQYEKEAQEDLATVYSKPPLKTPSPIERQAVDIYTNAVFEKFQEEFVESLGYYVVKIEHGSTSKYNVTKEDDTRKSYIVSFSDSDKKASCNCFKFERCGILCRHVLRVFFVVGVRVLSEAYVLKRWTRNALTNVVLEERVTETVVSFQEFLVAWYNDLCHDAVKFGMEGAVSSETYKVAKLALQKSFAEVIAAKNTQKKGQHNLQRVARLKKMQCKVPLPKLQLKKALLPRITQHDEDGRSKRIASDEALLQE